MIGIDIIENPRFARAMSRHPGLVERVFTPEERKYCSSRPNPVQHYAVRFAAKEAVGKALGTGVRCWREIEIGSGGKPAVRISGRMERIAKQSGAAGLAVSLSHADRVSVAVAVAAKTQERR